MNDHDYGDHWRVHQQPQQRPVLGPGNPGDPGDLGLPYYGIGFGPAVKRAYRKYATFDGRASRGEFWWFFLFQVCAFLVLGGLALGLGTATSSDGGSTPGPAGIPFLILLTIFTFGTLVPWLAIFVRRLHDSGNSGYLILLSWIPLLGLIVTVVLGLLPPSPTGARHDPVERAPREATPTSGPHPAP